MERAITVQGRGSASAAPDCVEIAIELTAKNLDYHIAINEASQKYARLLAALSPLGFRKEDVKTKAFHVNTVYDPVVNQAGGMSQQFSGYCCEQRLLIDFPFSTKNLSSVLDRLTASGADPKLSIQFTVQDPDALYTKALVDATANAYRTASILTQASRTTLGNILKIEYGEENKGIAYSKTAYDAEKSSILMLDMSRSMDVTPDDVRVEKTVTIVWEIRSGAV